VLWLQAPQECAVPIRVGPSCHDPKSKTCYDPKRPEDKKHNATVVCLARRRLNVLYVMVRNGTFYQAAPEKLLQAA